MPLITCLHIMISVYSITQQRRGTVSRLSASPWQSPLKILAQLSFFSVITNLWLSGALVFTVFITWFNLVVKRKANTPKLHHNISKANRKLENLTEREVTLLLICYLALEAIHLTAPFLFHYFHRRYKTKVTPTHIENFSGKWPLFYSTNTFRG